MTLHFSIGVIAQFILANISTARRGYVHAQPCITFKMMTCSKGPQPALKVLYCSNGSSQYTIMALKAACLISDSCGVCSLSSSPFLLK